MLGSQLTLIALIWMQQVTVSATAGKITVGEKIQLELLSNLGYFISRSRENKVIISDSGVGSVWLVKSGLVGQGISLQSSSGGYMRHYEHRALVNQFENTELFLKDASFIVEEGLAGKGISLRSVNLPDYLIGYNTQNEVWIKESDDSEEFKNSVTFQVQRYIYRDHLKKRCSKSYTKNEAGGCNGWSAVSKEQCIQVSTYFRLSGTIPIHNGEQF